MTGLAVQTHHAKQCLENFRSAKAYVEVIKDAGEPASKLEIRPTFELKEGTGKRKLFEHETV